MENENIGENSLNNGQDRIAVIEIPIEYNPL